MSVATNWPRRADGLPPGQRLLRALPRFSDTPKRWAPAVPDRPTLTLRHHDRVVVIPVPDLVDGGRFERIDLVADFHCVTTWSVRSLRWGGVALRDVVREAFGSVDPAPFARALAADGAASRFVIADLTEPDVLLATHLDGAALPLRHGAPLRLVAPKQYGYKNTKHLVEIEYVDAEPERAFGPKEHLRGRVSFEERHGRLPNWMVRWPYRAAIPITVRWAERAMDERPEGEPIRP